MNRLEAKYFYKNGDLIDYISYHVTTKLSLFDLVLEAREDPSFLSLVISNKCKK